MEFKIDTKDTFSIVKPLSGEIDANLAVELLKKCADIRQSGSNNFIIDLEACSKMDKSAVDRLVAMHEEMYSIGSSLVFTGINKQDMAVLKENETDLLLNIAPTMKEAIDIISMEILERDLFNEES
jgi:anti-anti-sigma factor